MNTKILYVGLDVDSKGISGCIISPDFEIIHQFRSKPNTISLINQLKKVKEPGTSLKICYEASFSAFALHRELTAKGFEVQVIAPSLIPRVAGKRVKTDRIDAHLLAKQYAKDLLTPVYVPDENDEALRDLIRSRRFVVDQFKKTKQHIISICMRMGWDYKNQSKSTNPSYWTARHQEWIAHKLKHEKSEVTKIHFNNLLLMCDSLKNQILSFEQDIERFSKSKKYELKINSFRCFRGIDTITAMTIITEVGDIKRFPHPAKLTSYIGFDIVEYSSGGKEKKFGISKLGNPTLRKTIVESCQMANSKPTVSRKLAKRRENATPKDIEIANRCMLRLHKKGTRLIERGKITNVVKIACAREMMNFVWESLTSVEDQQCKLRYKDKAAHG